MKLVMKITVYTISDCQFTKQEKEYLNANKLSFEEKNLETNKDFLTEMLAISNNFAGTPVTRVEKDDGSIAVLKGFTKEEFDTTFGFAATPSTTNSQTPTTTPIPVNETPTVVPPVAEVVPPVETPPTETVPPAPTPTPIETPVVEAPVTTVSDPLKSVMDDLQSKSEPTVTPTAEPTVTTPSTTDTTTPPTIPDFPAK
jgi:glutaredoxin